MMLNMPLTAERALAANRAYQQFVENIAFVGDAMKNWTGLVNNPNVNAATVADPADAGVDTTWATKTADHIIFDVNEALGAVVTGSNTVEFADTLLLPVAQFNLIASKRLPDSTISVLDWLMRYNVYTARTGRPLTIRAVPQLSTAGAGGVARMVVYRRDPSIVKMHIPMRHRFLPVWQTGPMVFDVPGIFRLGGVEVRRPGAMRYRDGI
jgi:hypothetical protein